MQDDSGEHVRNSNVLDTREDLAKQERAPVNRKRVVLRLLRPFLLCFLAIAGALIPSACHQRGTLTFALPTADWWTAAPFLVSDSPRFFSARQLHLLTVEVDSGLTSKNAVVAGTADVGVSAATPLALAAARREKLLILGTYLTANEIIGLLKPLGSKDETPPEPVAVVPSTISESYLYRYLTHIGVANLLTEKRIQLLQQRPAAIPSALRSASAKSAVIWEPFLSLAAEQTGYVVNRKVIEFPVSLFIVTRPEVFARRQADIEAFLKGVEDACRNLRDNSDDTRHEVERHFNFRMDFLTPTWPGVHYGLKHDQVAMKTELRREAEMAKALAYIKEIPSFDYLFHVGNTP
jgi:ABC-type nitrate/sulfonate/bicarbonate transport system substrate-binding protein